MNSDNKKHHVVVVGAGFGGLYAVNNLVDSNVEVTLIDRRNFHLFQPLLYQVATGTISATDVSAPIRSIFGDKKNITVRLDSAVGIDVEAKQLTTSSHTNIDYDDLIIATGVSHHYFGHHEWQKNAPGLKTIEDALEMRRKIFTAFELAENEKDPLKRKQLLTFVIVGGGPTGVELAGALSDLAYRTFEKQFHNINTREECKIYLIEGLPKVLPSFKESLSDVTKGYLQDMGVEVLTDSLVTDIQNDTVFYKIKNENKRIESKTILWGAGVKASAMGKILSEATGVKLDSVGRVMVNKDFSITDYENIFVIGDLARLKDGKDFLPGVATVAMQSGEFVAQLIKNRTSNAKRYKKEFKYKNKGSLAVIGRNKAVADLGYFTSKGFIAWILWIFIHILYLVGFGSKVSVVTKWALSYFNQDKGNRLIFSNKQ
ncbi:NAD(P)/FAD-dependent oxidoreductase [bacterium]|nr:NAD(P)/FAD-dependent oxidoreductase [bacterium]